MSDKGFNVDITFEPDTGFMYGGNRFNCGTWMDKMGESKVANTIGVPGTPRDGADIELVGLLKSTLRWTGHLNETYSTLLKADYVKLPAGEKIEEGKLEFSKWDKLIQQNFEKYFYIP